MKWNIGRVKQTIEGSQSGVIYDVYSRFTKYYFNQQAIKDYQFGSNDLLFFKFLIIENEEWVTELKPFTIEFYDENKNEIDLVHRMNIASLTKKLYDNKIKQFRDEYRERLDNLTKLPIFKK